MNEALNADMVRRAFDLPRSVWPSDDYWQHRRDAMEETRKEMRRAIEQLAEAFRLDARAVTRYELWGYDPKGGMEMAMRPMGKSSASRIPHEPQHPRKGDFDWLTGKPLQGRRYRQACRAYDRQVRARRRVQRGLRGL